MNGKGSLKTNALLNAILRVSEFLFPLITFPYVSRILLADGVGKVSFATSIVSYFLMFAMLGIPTYGIRECAKVRDDRERLSQTVSELFMINIIFGVITYVLFFIALFTVPRFYEDRVLFIVCALTILFNCIGMEWLYQSLEMYRYITIRSLIFKAIAVIAMFVFIHKQSDYVIYGGITIFAVSASNILNFISLRRMTGVRYGLRRWSDIRKHLKPVFIFFAMSCATTIYMSLDNVMLGFMKGDTEVGFYSAGVKIKAIMVSLVTSLGVVLLPRSSYYIEHNMMDDFARITRKAMNSVLIFALPASLYFMLFARECILVLSGESFRGGIIPMIIIMPTVLFIGMSNITGIQMLLPLGKEMNVLYSEIAGAVLDFAVNLILILDMGATGAAIGTLAAEILVWFVQFMALNRYCPGVYRGVRWAVIAGGLVLAAAASLWVRWMQFGNILKIIISGVLFFGIYFAVLLAGKETLVREVTGEFLSKLKNGRV